MFKKNKDKYIENDDDEYSDNDDDENENDDEDMPTQKQQPREERPREDKRIMRETRDAVNKPQEQPKMYIVPRCVSKEEMFNIILDKLEQIEQKLK